MADLTQHLEGNKNKAGGRATINDPQSTIGGATGLESSRRKVALT